MNEEQIILAAETLVRNWHVNEDGQIAALKGDGFAEGEAERLVAFLPMAFSRPVLEELGIDQFDTEVTGRDADGNWVSAELMRQPEYAAALKLARKHRAKGAMDHEVYKLIAGSSADIDAVSNALNQGREVAGGVISSVINTPGIARHFLK